MKAPIKQIQEALSYNPKTGILRWKISVGTQKAGAIAGCESAGYIHIRFQKRNYRAHQLAWAIVKGYWAKEIDHKDTNGTNNRWRNLREATHSQNHGNARLHRDAKCPYKGVTKRGKYNKWRARVIVGGKQFCLGYYDSAILAHAAYVMAAKHHFGEFARAR